MTKGDILIKLSSELKQFNVPEILCFEIKNWNQNQSKILSDIKKINSSKLIIRSSALSEDSDSDSKAGLYDSVMNVVKNDNEIISSVNAVKNSFLKKNNSELKNKIIAQKQLNDVSASGVIFTHELNTGAPYYVINYDDKSGSTDSVTSGSGEYSNRTLYIHRDYPVEELKSTRFKILLSAVKELESHMSNNYLDIEFALGKDFKPYLFQVRSLTTSINWNKNTLNRINEELKNIKLDIKKFFIPEISIYGDFSVLAQMSDWNPVEMLGRSPKRLDLSLYKTLITDSSWRIARLKMGYFHPEDKNLMISLSGQPFIDSRLSFNSFLPYDLSPDISNKLVNSWLNKLRENPHLHDKVEFDIALTCYSFDIVKKLNNHDVFFSHGEIDEIIKSYRNLTIELIKGQNESSIDNAMSKIYYLDDLFEKKYSNLIDLSYKDIDSIIKDTIEYGIIPFAILARHGFIAKTLFESIDTDDSFDDEVITLFYNSIHTVASDFHEDSIKLSKNEINEEKFMKKYGHLRPGTYDITSLRYDQMAIEMFKSNSLLNKQDDIAEFSIENYFDKINLVLNQHHFTNITAIDFVNYVSDAIKGREYAKFVFTKCLSMLLEVIAEYGNKIGLSREEISNLDINEISDLKDSKINKDLLIEKINFRKISNEISNSIRLPQVLFELSGVEVVPFQIAQPNFISTKTIEADLFYLKSVDEIKNIEDKIILIENADPGFDFIFNYPIKGLITKFGGSNSHMAIRCAEFDLPAAIGCGEQIFESLIKPHTKVKLNCLTNQIIKIL
jgi:glutamine kinase